MKLRVSFCVVMLAVAIACSSSSPSRSASAASPLSPSASAATIVNPTATIKARKGREEVSVHMQDACDPDTFNAPPPAGAGPGTCGPGGGGVTFAHFISELTKKGSAGPWHFAPGIAHVEIGQTFVALNTGGEVHTFTEVAQFGGGIVPPLNQLSGNPTVAPECLALEPDDFVPPGGTYREDVDHTGDLKFQCCIHPWMRLEASSR